MEFSHPPSDEELLHLYAAPSSPWCRANMVSTLDGRATGADGRSGTINSAADKRVFSALRASSAVVVVGAGTVREEGYRRLRTPERFASHRRLTGLPEHPVLAVVTATGDLPDRVLDPEPDRGRLLVLGGGMTSDRRAALTARLGPDDELLDVSRAGGDGADPAAAVAALHRRGLTEVLCEGGPRLLRDWVGAGVVDELCLTLRPLLVGGTGPRILEGDPVPAPLGGAEPLLVLQIGDDLMLRYRVVRA